MKTKLNIIYPLATLFLCLCSNIKAANFSYEGSFKSIFSNTEQRQENIFFQNRQFTSENRFRFQTLLQGENWAADYSGETTVFYHPDLKTKIPFSFYAPSSGWRAEWHSNSDTESELLHRIDRLWVQGTMGNVELRLGKQVLPMGVGQIFSAINQTPPLSFTRIDSEYRMAEDAVNLSYRGNTTIELRYLPELRPELPTQFHGRVKTSFDNIDFAITSGKSDRKFFIGGEFSANVSDFVLNAELISYLWQDRVYAQGLLGYSSSLTSTLSVKGELFYNGFGITNYSLTPQIHRSTPFLGNWYGGLSFLWELSSLWKLSSNTIINLRDPSTLINLSLQHSLFQNLDLMIGQYFSIGSKISEFGGVITNSGFPKIGIGSPDITYFLAKYSF